MFSMLFDMHVIFITLVLLASYAASLEDGSVMEKIIAANNAARLRRSINDLDETADDKINELDEEFGDGLIEGDIHPPTHVIGQHSIEKRSARSDQKYIWKDGIIPYKYDKNITPLSRAAVRMAIIYMNDKTCLTFRLKKAGDADWINFVVKSGCYSSVGKQGGGQDISVGKGCEDRGIVLHEMMHALGFYHESSRPDRDSHVTIMWENIKSGKDHNFVKRTSSDTQQINYDFYSIMHYGNYAYSKNGKPTIVATQDSTMKFGQHHSLSKLDITGLNYLYGCKKPGTTQWSDWSDCDSSCLKSRQRSCFGKSCSNTDKNGVETQYVSCPKSLCNSPVHGHWAEWSHWGPCSLTCGGIGTKQRIRSCTNPAPKHGGNVCSGDASAFAQCMTGSCNLGPFDTQFENANGFGAWQISGDINWQLLSGKTPSTGTGPTSDHTFGDSGDGKYAYLEASNEVSGAKAILQLQNYISSQSQCLTFAYHMNGGTVGSLETWFYSSGQKTKVFTKSGSQGNNWHTEQILIPSLGLDKIQIVATTGSGFSSDIAIDDVIFVDCSHLVSASTSPSILITTVVADAAVSTPIISDISSTSDISITSSAKISFDFENGLSPWQSTGELSWNLHHGSTPSSGTGPNYDHTRGNSDGHYVYMEASGKTFANSAILETKVDGAMNCVVEFYYHMYGSNMGSLKLIVDDAAEELTTLFEMSGDQGQEWKYGVTNIPDSSAPFTLSFVATRGNGYSSDICLDDIVLTGCHIEEPVASFDDNDFEAGLGAWMTEGKFAWSVKDGGTPSSNTGPSSDHTSGKGNYLYAEASGPGIGDRGILRLSGLQTASSDCTMDFFYHMYGDSMGSLEVIVEEEGGKREILFSESGNQGNAWKSATVAFTANKKFSLLFVAAKGNNFRSDIAIDDIAFKNC